MTSPRRTAARPAGFTERFAKVNGVRLRYLVGGHGSAVVLLHGYAETGHTWRPIMPILAERHTVVVPDLRGAGGSAKPASGYDKKNMAVDIHELAALLKLDRVRIVGHDIGLMVAYAYAAQFRDSTERVVLPGAFLERFRGRPETLRARGRSAALRPGLRAARCHARGLRVLP
jgi:pimeloyl-ACP methyl ester carboxylesterase